MSSPRMSSKVKLQTTKQAAPKPEIPSSPKTSGALKPEFFQTQQIQVKAQDSSTSKKDGSLNTSQNEPPRIVSQQSRPSRKPQHSFGGIRYPFKGKEAKSNVPEDFLTAFERTEIEDFEEVWFCAPSNVKYQATKLERLVNNGFDDGEGYYRF
jgi:hypothetical protein